MPASTPLISLLTDFGLQDVYVGVMKAVILSRCPDARLVDLTHQVPPGNMEAAGYLLSTAWHYFPSDAVHVAVVDPGVGSGRRILAAEVSGHHFVAPDNGLLSDVLASADSPRVVSVENEALLLKPTSTTFHGRDIFAPAAAALACGQALEDLGPAADSWEKLDRPMPQSTEEGGWVGRVIYVDRFGNLITDIAGEQLPSPCQISVKGHLMGRIHRSYADVPSGQLVALVGSTGRLEISVNRGSAAETMNVRTGDEVRVTPRSEAEETA